MAYADARTPTPIFDEIIVAIDRSTSTEASGQSSPAPKADSSVEQDTRDTPYIETPTVQQQADIDMNSQDDLQPAPPPSTEMKEVGLATESVVPAPEDIQVNEAAGKDEPITAADGPPTLEPDTAGGEHVVPIFPEPTSSAPAIDAAATSNATDSLPASNSTKVAADSSDIPPTPPTGRGRGRGRGRGGRPRSSVSNGLSRESPLATPNGTPTTSINGSARGSGRGRGRVRGTRGGRGGRGGRRKRNEDEIRAGDSPSDDEFDDELTDDEHSAVATATRFGRSVQKPLPFAPPTPTPAGGLKRKRTHNFHHSRNPELSVCRVCSRPHSPATNMIVFCDGCNTPYHRYCHRPSISQLVVDVEDKEWFCAECEAEEVLHYDATAFLPAEKLTDEKLRLQLSRLPSSVLVSLLVQAHTLHPDIPLIPPPRSAAPPPAPRPAPEPRIPPRISAPGDELVRPPDDELESGYESDPPAHYPLAGDGLAATLPPEREHESFLVDNNREVYTHLVQTDPKAANESLYGRMDVDEKTGDDKPNGEVQAEPQTADVSIMDVDAQ